MDPKFQLPILGDSPPELPKTEYPKPKKGAITYAFVMLWAFAPFANLRIL